MADETPVKIPSFSGTFNERIAKVEVELRVFNEQFNKHTEDDKEHFNHVRETLETMNGKLDEIRLFLAKEQGKEEMALQVAKSEGGKWGASVGAVISGIVVGIISLIKYLTGA